MNFFEARSQTPTLVLGRKCFDSDCETQDERLPLLIVLLQQLDTSIHGLEALPDYELSEIIFATVRVCGFVEPMDCTPGHCHGAASAPNPPSRSRDSAILG